ncbi:MAG: hypothetical protein Q8O67_18515 [Deltaproteobacteria bacterium]|nr:hypothetical protein [Deltaproteobacteria bacterium]
MQLTLALASTTRPVSNRRAARSVPALRTIRNSMVAGDELFDAVVFLAHALEIPALVPGNNDWANEVTAEFTIQPLPRSLRAADPDADVRPVRRAA